MIQGDSTICPICQKHNHCDVIAGSGCWCMNTQVPTELLLKIPEDQRGVSCICNQCIADYKQSLKASLER